MLLGSNTAGRETREANTYSRKKRGTYKQKISGKRGQMEF